jgi:hypothetical protein
MESSNIVYGIQPITCPVTPVTFVPEKNAPEKSVP